MALLFLHDNRRKYRRVKIAGVAVLQNDMVKGVRLVDVSAGGMKVLSQSLLPRKSAVAVEFKLPNNGYRLAPGKPVKARLVHAEVTKEHGTYALGFRFVDVNYVQRNFLESLTRPSHFSL